MSTLVTEIDGKTIQYEPVKFQDIRAGDKLIHFYIPGWNRNADMKVWVGVAETFDEKYNQWLTSSRQDAEGNPHQGVPFKTVKTNSSESSDFVIIASFQLSENTGWNYIYRVVSPSQNNEEDTNSDLTKELVSGENSGTSEEFNFDAFVESKKKESNATSNSDPQSGLLLIASNLWDLCQDDDNRRTWGEANKVEQESFLSLAKHVVEQAKEVITTKVDNVESKVEHRVISRSNHSGEEYEYLNTDDPAASPENMKESFSWLSTERAVGEFVRVERREVITYSSDWETVLPE